MVVALLRNTVVAQWFNCEERYIKITIHYTLRKPATLKGQKLKYVLAKTFSCEFLYMKLFFQFALYCTGL